MVTIPITATALRRNVRTVIHLGMTNQHAFMRRSPESASLGTAPTLDTEGSEGVLGKRQPTRVRRLLILRRRSFSRPLRLTRIPSLMVRSIITLILMLLPMKMTSV